MKLLFILGFAALSPVASFASDYVTCAHKFRDEIISGDTAPKPYGNCIFRCYPESKSCETIKGACPAIVPVEWAGSPRGYGVLLTADGVGISCKF